MFKESCSNYVFRIITEEGYKKGIKALRVRYLNFRPNYHLFEDKGEILLITAENEVIEENFIDDRIIFQCKNDM